MRIAHFADVHIRNFKYRNEYNAAFEDLYGKLKDLGPDLVVNCGDTVHSKLAVSPELFDDVRRHMHAVSRIAPYWIILGNHDLNLKNRGRTDAISPVVRALALPEVKLLDPGPHLSPGCGWRFKFWNFDIRGHEEPDPHPEEINIGLYHGSISGCVTDLGFTMEEGESGLEKFSGMDFVMLGDIHKRQSFRDGRIRYPGSLIQQNYGEEVEKGFLLWDIRDKDDWDVEFHPVIAPGRFYTVQVPADLSLEGVDVPQGSRIKAILSGDLTPSKRLDLERRIRERFDPLEVIAPEPSADRRALSLDDIVESRDKLALEFLAKLGCEPNEIDAVMALFHGYESSLDEASARGTTWKISRLSWDNMMNYGEGNEIDLTKLIGMVGIFAPNASGKSSIFDILLQALFDKIAKDVPRNIDLVNDNRDSARMHVELESNGRSYALERVIERVSYGQRKLTETKQWGKTSLEFSADGDSLNGDSRPETEREIRRVIGTFEDFVLTSMLSQNPIFGLPGGADIINCKETDRRKILFRFLDLDSYERIHAMARDDLKELMGGLKADRTKLAERLGSLEERKRAVQSVVATARGSVDSSNRELEGIRTEIRGLPDAQRAEEELDRLTDELGAANELLVKDREELESAETRLSDLLQKKGEHAARRPSSPEITAEDLAGQLLRNRARTAEAVRELSGSRDRLAAGKKALAILDVVPCQGAFPTCRFIADAVEFRDTGIREQLETAIGDLLGDIGRLDDEQAALEDISLVQKRILSWERTMADLELEISRCETHVAGLRATCESDQKIYDSALERHCRASLDFAAASAECLSALRSRENAAVRAAKREQAVLEEGMRELGALNAQEESTRDELRNFDTLKSRVRVHERLVEMCGKSGLPYWILTRVIPAVNDEIAKILGGLVKFNVIFEEDPEEETVGLSIRYGDYRSRPLSLGSGAEKFIASLAIRAALLSVSSLPKTDILIVDEGFGKLDPEHLEAVNRVMESLRSSFRTIFLVSHVDSMRDIVDHSIDIISRAGYAHVEAT